MKALILTIKKKSWLDKCFTLVFGETKYFRNALYDKRRFVHVK